MKIADFNALVRDYLDTFCLADWRWKFDNAKVRAGLCNSKTKTLSFSRHYVKLNDEALVRNTILHEIAHALVGTGRGHGVHWRAAARFIGCTAQRCYNSNVVKMPVRPYIGRCPNCKREQRRHKRQDVACGRCCKRFNGGRYDARFKITYTRI
jgi:predicted SprT family Zn-dependent metalloprotease